MAAGWGGDCSCDWVAACADRRFGLRSEAPIRTPQQRGIAMCHNFKCVFNFDIVMAINTQLQRMWFSAL